MIKPFSYQSLRGYTLIELATVITILALVAGYAYSSYQDLLYRNRANSISSSFLQTLRFARNEAIRRNRCVMVCDLITTKNTEGTCWNSTPNFAASGYSVFVVPACTVPLSPGVFTIDYGTDANILRRQPADSAAVHGLYGLLQSQQFVNATNGLKSSTESAKQAGYVMFNAKGQLAGYTEGVVFQAFGDKKVATGSDTQPISSVDKKICVLIGGETTLIDINQSCAN